MESTQNQFTESEVMKPYFSQNRYDRISAKTNTIKEWVFSYYSILPKLPFKIILTFDWLKLQRLENIVWPKTRQCIDIHIVWI